MPTKILIRSNADPCSPKDDSIPVSVSLPKSERCSSSGDPHIINIQGTRFDDQTVGWKSLFRSDRTWVAAYQEKCYAGSYVACNKRIIIQDNDKTYFLSAANLVSGQTVPTADGASITMRSYDWVQSSKYININMEFPGSYAAQLRKDNGLCGVFQTGAALTKVPAVGAEPFNLATCWDQNSVSGSSCSPSGLSVSAQDTCSALPSFTACPAQDQSSPSPSPQPVSSPVSSPSPVAQQMMFGPVFSSYIAPPSSSGNNDTVNDDDVKVVDAAALKPCYQVLSVYPDCSINPDDSAALKSILTDICTYDNENGTLPLTKALESMADLYVDTCLANIVQLAKSNITHLQTAGAGFMSQLNPVCLNGGPSNTEGVGCKCPVGFYGIDCSVSQTSFNNNGQGNAAIIGGVSAAAFVIIGIALFVARRTNKNRLLAQSSVSVASSLERTVSRENPLYAAPRV
jgi:hypothetical protein